VLRITAAQMRFYHNWREHSHAPSAVQFVPSFIFIMPAELRFVTVAQFSFCFAGCVWLSRKIGHDDNQDLIQE
jgi:hypothetical protein